MKKLSAVLLTIILSAAMMTGCGSGSASGGASSSGDSSPSGSEAGPQETDTSAPAENSSDGGTLRAGMEIGYPPVGQIDLYGVYLPGSFLFY